MEAGTRVGKRYEIRSVGGKSWLGQRYRARDLEVDFEVALLSVNLQLLPDGDIKRALPHFVRLKSLQTPQIVRMYDAFEEAGALYVVEPWLEAVELRKYVAGMHKRREVMTEEELIDFVQQLVNGLDYAHRGGLLVPELSSETVFVDGSGLRIAGVGYAQAVGQERLRQQLVETAGERALPPELLAGQPTTIRTDVYRLAQLVVELARRTPLHKGEPPLAHALDETHHKLALGIERGLAAQPELRPESPTALLRLLWPQRFMAPDVTELDATSPVMKIDPSEAETPADVPTREIDVKELRRIQGKDVTRRVSDEELFPHRVLAATPETALFDERAANIALQSQSPIGLYDGKKETTTVGKKPAAPESSAPAAAPTQGFDEEASKEIDILELPSEDLADESDFGQINTPAPAAPPVPSGPPKRLTAMQMIAASQAKATTQMAAVKEPPAASQQFDAEPSKIIEIVRPKPQPHHAAAVANEKAREQAQQQFDAEPSKIIEIVRPPDTGPIVLPNARPAPAAPAAALALDSSASFASLNDDLQDDALTTPHQKLSAEELGAEDVLVTDKQHIVPTPHELREASGPFAIPSPSVQPEPLPPPPIAPPPKKSSTAAIVGGALIVLALAAVGYAALPYLTSSGANPSPPSSTSGGATPNAGSTTGASNPSGSTTGATPTPVPSNRVAATNDLASTPTQPIVTKPDVPAIATPPSPTPSAPIANATGGCPDAMKPIAGKPKVCVDQYEFPGKGQAPKTAVTLMEAGQLCARRGARLCLDAEWEAACRGPKAASYPYGGGHDPKKCNEDKARGLVPTGTFAECLSASDAYDMSGNAAEWVQSGNVRGGAAGWGNPRCSQVAREKPEAQNPLLGFRCCSDLPD